MRATLIIYAPAATNPRSLRLLKYLSMQRVHCQVVTTSPSGSSDQPPSPDDPPDRIEDAKVVLFPPWQGSLFRQAFERTRFVLKSASFVRNFESDVVIASDIEGLMACGLRSTGASRIIYDIRDSTARRFYRLPRPFVLLLCWIETVLVRQVSSIVIVDERRRGELQESVASHPGLVAIENFPDDCNASVQPSRRIADANELQVCLCGYLTRLRGLDLARSVISQVANARLVLFGKLGSGITEAEIRSTPRTVYLGTLSHSEALSQMKASDLVLALYDPQFPGHRICAPNKLYEAFMLGRPVLVNRGTGIEEIVAQEGAGLVIDYHDRQTFMDALTFAARERDGQLRGMAERARTAFETKYNSNVYKDRLDRVLGL